MPLRPPLSTIPMLDEGARRWRLAAAMKHVSHGVDVAPTEPHHSVEHGLVSAVGAGNNSPALPIPMLDKNAKLVDYRAAAGSGSDRPDVVGRKDGDARQIASSSIQLRRGHLLPSTTVPMDDQSSFRRCSRRHHVPHGPSIPSRKRADGLESDHGAFGDADARTNDAPPGSVPVLDQRKLR